MAEKKKKREREMMDIRKLYRAFNGILRLKKTEKRREKRREEKRKETTDIRKLYIAYNVILRLERKKKRREETREEKRGDGYKKALCSLQCHSET